MITIIKQLSYKIKKQGQIKQLYLYSIHGNSRSITDFIMSLQNSQALRTRSIFRSDDTGHWLAKSPIKVDDKTLRPSRVMGYLGIRG